MSRDHLKKKQAVPAILISRSSLIRLNKDLSGLYRCYVAFKDTDETIEAQIDKNMKKRHGPWEFQVAYTWRARGT